MLRPQNRAILGGSLRQAADEDVFGGQRNSGHGEPGRALGVPISVPLRDL